MERREFLILAAAGSASTLALQGCSTEHPEPLYIANDKYIPGADYWYATVCGQCAAGCGVIVRKRDGNVNKIEGNPLHPISRGKLCARGQAGLNELYNPDRIKGPWQRTGARGSGQYQKIEWDEAIKLLAEKLNALRASNEARSVAWLEGSPALGLLTRLVEDFLKTYGSDKLFFYHPFSRGVERKAAALSFGRELLPTYNLAGADYVLSFGARFLETWGSPVYYSRGFGEMRRGRRLRGRFVQAEPRMSLTAANADEWLPVKPGAEGYLATAIAAELARIQGKQIPNVASIFSGQPEKIEETTGIGPATIRRVAADLAEAKAVAVFGGDAAAAHTNGLFNLLAINYLNTLVNSAGIHYAFPAGPRLSDKLPGVPGDQSVAAGLAARASEIKALLIHDANPLYSAPAALNLRAAFDQIPFIVSFSSFEDETTGYADLILPDHTSFERWGATAAEEGPPQEVHSFSQPVVEPLYQTRHTGDVLLALAKQVAPLASIFKAPTVAEMLKHAALGEHRTEKDWEAMVLRGGKWNDEQAPHQPGASKASPQSITATPKLSAVDLQPSLAQFAGDEKEFPFHFLPYEHLALGDGRTANQPLLQELPDPMTAVVWGSWVEINPQTAAKLGINHGDLVTVESQHGRVEAPAVLYPAIRPDVVAMPTGQGHERYGRYASHRGANPLQILAPLTEPQTGALAWAATRVRVSKAAGRTRLVTFGTDERLLEDQEKFKR